MDESKGVPAGDAASIKAEANAGADGSKLIVDGVEYNPEEIKRLRDARANFERDYNKKTEKVSAAAKAAREREASLQQREEELKQKESALADDYDFFTTQPSDKWADYTPKVLKAGAPQRTDVAVEKLSKIEQRLDMLAQRELDREADANVDKVFSYVEAAMDAYKTVSERGLLACVQNFARDNEKPPSKAEVFDMAREMHQDLVRRGVSVREKEEPAGQKGSDGGVKPPPQDLGKPQISDMRNTRAFLGDGEKWLEGYRARTASQRR